MHIVYFNKLFRKLLNKLPNKLLLNYFSIKYTDYLTYYNKTHIQITQYLLLGRLTRQNFSKIGRNHTRKKTFILPSK